MSAGSSSSAPGRGARRHDRLVVVFTKPAIAGRVKTRLVSDEPDGLAPATAARLHAAFVGDLTEELLRGSYELRVAWDLRPGEEPDAGLLAQPLPGFAQQGRDLGERLLHALSRHAASHAAVAAVGSDHPTLEHERVEAAFEALAAGTTLADVVLGPAEDGGYYLIAVRSQALSPRLFAEIEWSSARVLEQTLERCRETGSKVHLLPPAADVDRPEDLVRLREVVGELPPQRCRRTRRALRELGEDASFHRGTHAVGVRKGEGNR